MAKKKKKTRLTQEERRIRAETASDTAAGQAFASSLPLARTPEEQAILDSRRSNYEASGQLTTEQAQTRKDLRDGTTSVYDPLKDTQVQDLLSRYVSSLGGLSAEENQALRAQMIRSEQAGTSSALRGLRSALGSAGVTGQAAASAAGNIYRNALIARALGESDLAAKNVELKQTALTNYGNALGAFTGQSISSEQQRGERLGILSNYELGFGKVLSDQRASAADAYSKDALAIANNERQNLIQAYLGGQGLNMARRGAIRGNKLAKEGLALARSAYN